MYKKLEIKNPCTQNWDEMKPLENGKHCSSCNHVIHDFSEMNDSELLTILQSGKYRCGMFTKDQMGTMYLEKEKSSNRKKYWNAIAASIVAGTLQLTMGYGQVQTPIRKNAPILDRSTMEKFFEDKTEPTIPGVEKVQKEKFSFIVVDSKTKQPLGNTQVEMMGITSHTDSLGRVDFKFEYKEGNRIPVIATIYLYSFGEAKQKLNLYDCFKKLTFLSLKPKRQNKKDNYILGLWM